MRQGSYRLERGCRHSEPSSSNRRGKYNSRKGSLTVTTFRGSTGSIAIKKGTKIRPPFLRLKLCFPRLELKSQRELQDASALIAGDGRG